MQDFKDSTTRFCIIYRSISGIVLHVFHPPLLRATDDEMSRFSKVSMDSYRLTQARKKIFLFFSSSSPFPRQLYVHFPVDDARPI